MPPQLIALQISGVAEPQGSTGDVLRLAGTGHSQLLLADSVHTEAASPREAACETIVTFTGPTTFQEISRLTVAAGLPVARFASLGSGYLLAAPLSQQQSGVSIGRQLADAPARESLEVVFSWLEIDRARQTFAMTAVLVVPKSVEEMEKLRCVSQPF